MKRTTRPSVSEAARTPMRRIAAVATLAHATGGVADGDAAEVIRSGTANAGPSQNDRVIE